MKTPANGHICGAHDLRDLGTREPLKLPQHQDGLKVRRESFEATVDLIDRLFSLETSARILDPFVDKALICGSLVLFLGVREVAAILPAWIVVVVLTREFLVQSLRAMSEAQGKSFAADLFAKWKMTFQAVWVQALAAYLCGWDVMLPVATWCMWIALAFTVLSGANYVRRAWGILDW